MSWRLRTFLSSQPKQEISEGREGGSPALSTARSASLRNLSRWAPPVYNERKARQVRKEPPGSNGGFDPAKVQYITGPDVTVDAGQVGSATA
jgi:hypothetical protein